MFEDKRKPTPWDLYICHFDVWLLEWVVGYWCYLVSKRLSVSYYPDYTLWLYGYGSVVVILLICSPNSLVSGLCSWLWDKCYARGFCWVVYCWLAYLLHLSAELPPILPWGLVKIVSWLGWCCPNSWLYLSVGMLIIILSYLVFWMWLYTTLSIAYMGFEPFLFWVIYRCNAFISREWDVMTL